MHVTPMQSADLEAIVLLLELGAIELTPEPNSTFTYEQLYAEARSIGGDDFTLDERDVKIVMPHMRGLLKKLPGGLYQLV